jgi:hypothetical protein
VEIDGSENNSESSCSKGRQATFQNVGYRKRWAERGTRIIRAFHCSKTPTTSTSAL